MAPFPITVSASLLSHSPLDHCLYFLSSVSLSDSISMFRVYCLYVLLHILIAYSFDLFPIHCTYFPFIIPVYYSLPLFHIHCPNFLPIVLFPLPISYPVPISYPISLLPIPTSYSLALHPIHSHYFLCGPYFLSNILTAYFLSTLPLLYPLPLLPIHCSSPLPFSRTLGPETELLRCSFGLSRTSSLCTPCVLRLCRLCEGGRGVEGSNFVALLTRVQRVFILLIARKEGRSCRYRR